MNLREDKKKDQLEGPLEKEPTTTRARAALSNMKIDSSWQKPANCLRGADIATEGHEIVSLDPYEVSAREGPLSPWVSRELWREVACPFCPSLGVDYALLLTLS